MTAILPPAALRSRLGGALVDEPTARYTPMRDATAERDRLDAVLTAHAPACAGDDRFTADHPTTADVDAMAAVCATCPAQAACDDYAAAALPPVGVWAGTRYPRREATR
ncbi:WhiB family transcriptional regulator [Microbacterium marinilacus]|uniref:4Fe-4S Wbl-type domain-containing protein n=1 Tax=Microbacterium marinilacus TaxID=415209 RepID=A0ABP7BAC1_9MICO|nr:WhiB family transcriptional regulator [Microbacterium marinilacus]MBY0687008.1 WhiB family transcriptional regulator [Microbacterium marinilacus]